THPNCPRSNYPTRKTNPFKPQIVAAVNFTQDVFFWYTDVVEDQSGRSPFAHRIDVFGFPAHVPVDDKASNTGTPCLLVQLFIRNSDHHDEISFISACDKGFLPV